ncbi:hypothetical protein [Caenibius sp. WL]|uniref:hypothetical protein n=1 Tax=Caenibius sp. WL TaxID=2872646 RepID=UPI001C9903BA|nr:hypothetical protein [Caenibius sp. WL]QZP08177.1 hypothetical protein K5X80_16345 [Caenibius sp. WL]
MTERLKRFGSYLEGENRHAIHALLQALESGLNGTLEDGYHLSAIDPGIGKTLSVSVFLGAWKDASFNPSASVLIGLSRLEEIDSYLENAGLDQKDVAVLTSDTERNALGVPKSQHNDARIMFTTQQMIERRTRGKAFADASEFHFEGQPRTLRIWDESFLPAEQLALRADDLARLPAALAHEHEYAAEVRALVTRLWTAEGGEQLTVPHTLNNLQPLATATRGTQLSSIVETLGRLAGRETAVIATGDGSMRLAGSAAPIPPDFAPVIILDASGRVRSTYRVWEESGAQLHRLPSAVKDYRNLHINLWERPAGQRALRPLQAREEIAEAIASAVREDLGAPWLIISYKDQPIEDQLRAALEGIEPEGGLHFLTWGMHHGTNAYTDCKNVVLVGHLNYGPAGYRALLAAAGGPLGASPREAAELLMGGEYRHNWLQALTRASVRNSNGNLAGSCNAYVIASPGTEARKHLEAVFPGCEIDTWEPEISEPGGHAGKLVALLDQARADGNLPIRKKELREKLGMPEAAHFSRLVQHPAVQACLDRNHLRSRGQRIESAVSFEPLEGDGFSIEDIDDEL